MGNKVENYDDLLAEYRLIWNNRMLAADGKTSEEILLGAIRRELLDESSHPRIQKNRFEKYYFAIKRLLGSTISNETKVRIISLHNQIMEELNKGGE